MAEGRHASGQLASPLQCPKEPHSGGSQAWDGLLPEAYALSCSALRVPNGAGRQQGHGPHGELHTQNTNPRNSPELRLWPLH